jgi:hypothetical protein
MGMVSGNIVPKPNRQGTAREPPGNRQETAREPPGNRQGTAREPPGNRQGTISATLGRNRAQSNTIADLVTHKASKAPAQVGRYISAAAVLLQCCPTLPLNWLSTSLRERRRTTPSPHAAVKVLETTQHLRKQPFNTNDKRYAHGCCSEATRSAS